MSPDLEREQAGGDPGERQRERDRELGGDPIESETELERERERAGGDPGERDGNTPSDGRAIRGDGGRER